ncbi:PEPxxWA-CTERM sorting domain-containing protein [Phenylobacterium sp.]|uniref:PEPxxWA-CTERM sorting domain-containing protein n=1 Tax=Phenylobacterium sp. TaxID=1871053 RepID=UPI00301BFB56
MRKLLLLAATAALAMPASAMAQAIITNGTVGLGVDRGGQLNIPGGPLSAGGETTYYGLRDIATGYESTAPGCLCEGWGAAVQGSGVTVYANNSSGSSYNEVSFASTASTATTVVTSVGGELTVTHAFSPSSTPYLYQVEVTITNTSGADFAGSTLYRRTMDWDIEPTAFDEYSTIQGTTGATNVLSASADGFCNSNPLAACDPSYAQGDFVDAGPNDHGAEFTFIFDPLLAGASQTLTIFYGAAPTEALALAALGSVGAEIYSFGQSVNDKLGGTPGYATFIFGFKGVGGQALPDPTGGIPEPGTWALMILGFGAAGSMLRRRRVAFA